MRAFLFSLFLTALLTATACGGGGGGSSSTVTESQTAAPTISPAGGSYTTAQMVTLTTSTAGASLYYTLDGTTPTTASAVYAAAIPVTQNTTVKALAVATGYTNSDVTSAAYTVQNNVTAAQVTTSADLSSLMASGAALGFATGTASAAWPTITLDEAQSYQTVEGFGASMTDSAAYLLNEVAPTTTRDAAMSNLFGRGSNGIGLSFLRNPMGASDIARAIYSYDDNGGAADTALANFSMAHDEADILPLTLAARTLNPSLKVMVTPWSPPGWMKTNSTMIGQVSGGTAGALASGMESAWAQYFVKTIEGYQAAGIPVDYLSAQNEPLYAPSDYPGMMMAATAQTTLLRDDLLPALSAAGLTTRVLLYDHNWDTASYPETVLADATLAASGQIAGVAWHGYEGTPGAMNTLHNQFSSMGQYVTEHSGGTWVSNQVRQDFEEMTQAMRNWGKAYVKWSLALNEARGPYDGGCSTCSAPITVNSTSGAVTYNAEFYTLGQFSKYVLPGATRVYSSNALGLVSAAFVNPDGSRALVVFNDTAAAIRFQVQWGGQLMATQLAGLTGATYSWNGAQSASPLLNAKAVTMASGYSTATVFQTETTTDTGNGYDLGYSANGAVAVYKNMDFGSGVNGVKLREACDSSSGNCGGTVEFHLDSATGTLLATVPMTATGGWQTWQTVAGTISSSASGTHDLYLVMKNSGAGTSAVGNLNWFQFN
ncbi:MAG: carbohydrate-binding protein [Acidobacteriota bacterium]|nr:carbohydrate-binding protein [Acidobacteriota bacterium]